MSHLTSPPHTPEHNGYAKHHHRHIVETGLSLLSHALMPLTYWSFAFSTAVYLINRLPTPTLDLISLYHKLFVTPPNYSKSVALDVSAIHGYDRTLLTNSLLVPSYVCS